MTIGVLFHYGEETINSVVCELSKLNLIPEIMVEVVSENIQIWFDNFIKATFVNTNPSTEQLLVCCNTYIDWRWDRCRLVHISANRNHIYKECIFCRFLSIHKNGNTS